MKAFVAASSAPDAQAGQDLERQLTRCPISPPCAALVLASSDQTPYLQDSIDRFRRQLGSAVVVGGSSGRVVTRRNDAAVLGVMVLGDGTWTFPTTPPAEDLSDPTQAGDLIVLADPRVDAPLLRNLAKRGRVAGGGIEGTERFLLSGGGIGEGGSAALRLPEGALLVSSACGITPSGPSFEVTGARGRSLTSLAGAPPLQALLEHFRSIGKLDEPSTLEAGLFLSVMDSDGDAAGRVITSVDERSGSLELDQPIDAGSQVSFATRDIVGAQRSFHQMLERLKRDADGRPVAACLLFSSAQRLETLDPTFEVGAIGRAFPDAPLLGMGTSFELSPKGIELYSAVLALVLQ